MTNALPCWIYKSPLKEEMYLYINEQDDFGQVPGPLLKRFGQPVFVMELALHEERSLAREDAGKVMRNLAEHGFHLQMPPDLKPDLYHGNLA